MHGVLPSSSDESVKLVQADELATKANSKLVREAKRPEHCLLRLVLTANLLDDLNDEMENLKLRAQPPPLAGQKVRWADRVLESIEALHNDEDGKDAQDSSDTDGDSDADCEEAITPPPLTSDNQMCLEVADSTLDDQEYREVFTDLEAAEDLALKRFPSGSTQSPNGPLDKNIQVVVVELESDLADVETF